MCATNGSLSTLLDPSSISETMSICLETPIKIFPDNSPMLIICLHLARCTHAKVALSKRATSTAMIDWTSAEDRL